jgi:soluble lytic murein transglycosylase-like protein
MMRTKVQMRRTLDDRLIPSLAILGVGIAVGLGCAQGILPVAETPFVGDRSADEIRTDPLGSMDSSEIVHRSTGNDPEAPTATEDCHWIKRTQAGRAALAGGDLAKASEEYRAAFTCTARFSQRDARVRTSLGHLVSVAAAYHHGGDGAAAASTMREVRERSEQRGLHASVVEELDIRFEELTIPKRRFTRFEIPRSGPKAPNRRRFDRMIFTAAQEFNVEPALVKAVVAAESNFDARAVSPVGAQGLMQLMPQTARAMGVDWPFDPRDNLKGGVRYLRAMLDRFDDTKYALAAYNAGPEAVDRYGGIPPYRETREYVQKVLRFYASYRTQAFDPALADSGS